MFFAPIMVKTTVGGGGSPTGSQTLDFTLGENVFNLDLWQYLSDRVENLSGYSTINFTIPSDRSVGSTVLGGPALTTGSFGAGYTITIINNGQIVGRGGYGGNYDADSPTNGEAGGLGMLFTTDATVTNNGLIAGGGGGGAGGNTAFLRPGEWDAETQMFINEVAYSVGGGGAGLMAGLSGSGPEGRYAEQSGTLTLGGGAYVASTSGAGGNLGQAGGNGTGGATGGAAGDAIDKDGNTVTVTNNGTITGSVVA